MADRFVRKHVAPAPFDVLKAASENGKKRRTVGHMTVGSPDSELEIVDQDTAGEAMRRAMATGGLTVLWNHDRGGGIGYPVEWSMVDLAADEMLPQRKALRVVTEYGSGGYKISPYSEFSVDDAWAQIAQGVVRKHSIGALVRDDGTSIEGMPVLKVMRIAEYSVVTVPAHEEAAFIMASMKSLGVPLCTSCKSAVSETYGDLEARLSRRQLGAHARHMQELARKVVQSDRDEQAAAEIAKQMRAMAEALS